MTSPRLTVDLDLLESAIEHSQNQLYSNKRSWRPDLRGITFPDFIRVLNKWKVHSFQCTNSTEASAIAAHSQSDILISQHPITFDEREQISELCKSHQILIACNHFLPAYQLSQLCEKKHVECGVLIEIDACRNGTGVTPGRDAIELACGINKLSGVRLRGLMMNESRESCVITSQIHHAIATSPHAAFEETRQRFVNMGLPTEISSIYGPESTSSKIPPISLQPCNTQIQFTEVRSISNLLTTSDHRGNEALIRNPNQIAAPDEIWSNNKKQQDANPTHWDSRRKSESTSTDFRRHQSKQASTYVPFVLSASVLSRPSLDRAMINAGMHSFHFAVNPPRIRRMPDAEIIEVASAHSIIHLGKDSQSLKIGDSVDLIVDSPRLTIALHDRIECHCSGTPVGTWFRS